MAPSRPPVPRLVWIAGAVLFAAVSSVGAPNLLVGYAARGYDYTVPSTVPSRSVAIVPGARVQQGKPFVHLQARLQAALDLYRSGKVKTILVSGNNSEQSPEVNAMRTWLLEHDVPNVAIWTDEKGLRTRDTMTRAVSEFGVIDAVVCTEDVNMPRTLFLAQEAGIDAVGLVLPSDLRNSRRYTAAEALKTTLAFLESKFRARPGPPAAGAPSAIASR